MADPLTFKDVHLEAEHVPETHRTLGTDGGLTEQDLPGSVNVYLVLDGARLLFTQYKGGKVLDALQQAEDAKQADKAE